jgi:hypothetical protein
MWGHREIAPYLTHARRHAMPKIFDSWIANALLTAVFFFALLSIRPLPTPYCPKCKKPTLRRRKCTYANAPAEKATCTNVECHYCFVQTAYRMLTYADDLNIVVDTDEDY